MSETESVYKWIRMVNMPSTGKTMRWFVENQTTATWIGFVAWHGAWRQYCFFPNANTVYSRGCMKDIADFLDKQMALRQPKSEGERQS